MKWIDFVQDSPDLAALGEEYCERCGLVYVGTLRRNGFPRICPVEPLFAHGELYLGMIWQSKKALDLLRDPRCTVHSIVTDRHGTDGEFKLYGRARDVQDPSERERFAEAVFQKIDWRPPEPFHAFALELESAAWRRFSEGSVNAMVWRLGEGTEQSEQKV